MANRKNSISKTGFFMIFMLVSCFLLSGVAGATHKSDWTNIKHSDTGRMLMQLGHSAESVDVQRYLLDGMADREINGSLGAEKPARGFATKVVPVYSLAKETHVGMVQVTGLPEAVERVWTVLEREVRISGITGVALVPVDEIFPLNTESPDAIIRRVDGVGVSAVFTYDPPKN